MYQQDGAGAPHYDMRVRNFLNEHFPARWIGRRGAVEWSACQQYPTPLHFFLCGFKKLKCMRRDHKTSMC